MKSIPKVAYPLAIDSDYTLFRTYNTSQATLARDLNEVAEIIEITPRSSNEADIWPDNGFVTIGKEIIYYDGVVKNSSGKVVQFKDCMRAVEGKADSYQAGLLVYGNVVAQTHNQLIDAVMAIENTIGDISSMLQTGKELKVPQGVRAKKNMVGRPNLVADVDHTFASSLHSSLSSMMAASPVTDDTCPDVEFEFNLIGSTAEYCVNIYGDYDSFQIDFGDGNFTSTQLSGTHEYSGGGPFSPNVTVITANCTVVQTPSSDSATIPTIPDPSVPFIIQIPLVPDFPNFIPPVMVCPGPLFNLPPILTSEMNLCPSQISMASIICPSVIISIIETCKTPQVIKILSPCRISIVSLVGCSMPSVISIVGCCPPSIISVIAPTFDTISFATPPSFGCISFCQVPSFDCISFCQVPSFAPISFAPFPSVAAISFDVLVNLSVAPICFCPPPSFACISFCPPPPISVIWGIPPTVSCIVTVACPSSTSCGQPCNSSDNTFGLHEPNFDEGIPVNFEDIGIPKEIKIIAPRIPDLKLIHDIPREISVKHTIPEEIRVRSDIPTTINIVSDIPSKIVLDASEVPKKILVEPSPNFPSTIKLEVIGMPQTLQVTGIPSTIEIIESIPRTIQLLMPEDPVVKMRWDGVPVEMKPSPDLEKMLSNIMIQPR